MSTGAIFQLITNEGKQDRMLMATGLLNKRLTDITQMRRNDPRVKDDTPTLVDIERTHILFVNAHFKPFAAIAYEYNKIGVQNNAARLGATDVQFSIPQFGDFFNDMVLHLTLSSVTATNAAYWSDSVTYPAKGAELLRYVDYLGLKLLKKVAFSVNGSPLDDYDTDVMNFHSKYFVTPNKVHGWKKNVGQEISHDGYSYVNSANSRVGRGAGVREVKHFVDGPQTPKPTQDAVDLWIPLLFWFNLDCRLAVPSVSIPYGQRFISIDFANANEVLAHLHAFDSTLDSVSTNPPPTPDITTCELYINNLFVNPEIHDIFIKRVGFSLIRVHRRQTNRLTGASNADTSTQLFNLKWPIETIYFGLRPIGNIDTTSTNMLTDWHSHSNVVHNTVDTGALANGYYFAGTFTAPATPTAAEILANFHSFTGLAPAAAPLGTTYGQINAWLTTYGFQPIHIPTGSTAATAPSGPQLIAAAGAASTQVQAQYTTQSAVCSNITVTAQGVPLYNNIPFQFFNSYVPFTFGGTHINTPEDAGVGMLTFNLYPGSYQPSGHINVSRSREFYFQAININTASCDLVVSAVALNFLLISDGSAILRYST